MRLRSGLLALVLCVARSRRLARWLRRPPARWRRPPARAGARPCRSRSGARAAHGLDDARAVALSPDGKSLYVASATPATVTTFTADSRNGLLQQLNLSAGCLTSIAQADCGGARALEGASAIAVSPDGLHVYVAAAGGGRRRELRAPAERIARAAHRHRRLRHDHADARLRQRAGPGGRRRDRDLARRALRLRRRGLGGRHHGVLARRGDRSPARRSPAPRAACAPTAPPARPSAGVDAPSGIAISPDGDIALRHLDRRHPDLVPARRDDRDAARSCRPDPAVSATARYDDCTPIGGLARASAVAVSPDGTHRARGRHRRRRRARRSGATPPRGALTRVACVAGTPRRPAACSRRWCTARARSPSAPTRASSGSRPPGPTRS